VILHVATFRWKPTVTEEDVAGLTADLRAMARSIPEIRSYVCGTNLRLRPGADFAVAAVVEDEAGLSAYLDSEAHRQVYADWLEWMIESRDAAQLDVEQAVLT
jgi:hypothetical protein